MKAELKGKLHGDISYTRDRKQIISFELDGDITEYFDEFNTKELDIIVKPHRERRSLDANAYCWVLIDKLSETLRLPKIEIYREAIKSIGGVSETVCVPSKAIATLTKAWEAKGTGWQVETMPSKLPGCTNAVLYFGSSVFDKNQMSMLIDNLIEDCRNVGIPTETPDEIENLKSLWATAPKGKENG